jgi:heme exporter protein A
MRVIAAGLGVRLSGRVIFENVAFEWNGPGIYTVTGNNGAGKTTLLKVVAALLHPGRGTMRWENSTTAALTPAQARAHLGFAGPEIGLWEDLTALENFAFGARARGLDWSVADGAAWLERLGLTGRGDERLAGFSSGMKQRVKIAFAMLGRPGLVILDEPGSNLDDRGRAVVDALVREAAEHSLVVVATNDPVEAAWGRPGITL